MKTIDADLKKTCIVPNKNEFQKSYKGNILQQYKLYLILMIIKYK